MGAFLNTAILAQAFATCKFEPFRRAGNPLWLFPLQRSLDQRLHCNLLQSRLTRKLRLDRKRRPHHLWRVSRPLVAPTRERHRQQQLRLAPRAAFAAALPAGVAGGAQRPGGSPPPSDDGDDDEDDDGADGPPEAAITEGYNLTFSEEELENITANLSTEAASGPVGERDAGLAVGEYASIASVKDMQDGLLESEPSREWSPVALKEVMINAELQHNKLAADETFGTLYASLKDEGKAALALTPYVALAMFGAISESAEVRLQTTWASSPLLSKPS